MNEFPAGWIGTIAEFVTVSRQDWLTALTKHHEKTSYELPSKSQIEAWKNCHAVLLEALQAAINSKRVDRSIALVFECELPRERGRRPDVVFLMQQKILVVEFKDYERVLLAHVGQVDAYARDISEYHALSHEATVQPVLLLTKAGGINEPHGGVQVLGRNAFTAQFSQLLDQPGISRSDMEAWLNADYAPLPTLVAAAKSLFDHDPLPAIRRALSAGIPKTLAVLRAVAAESQQTGTKHLALVTGVPGAGKTLVGLQFVYDSAELGGAHDAVFLSGNGPLVDVLQYALKNKIFVQDVHGFLKQYGGSARKLPSERIWVYDEAQRAWDEQRSREKRGPDAVSEPYDFIRLGNRVHGWAMIIGLIGEGQEIHLGEEAGIQQWNSAIQSVGEAWIVHCPSRIASFFPSASRVITDDSLNLTISLRSHLAEDVQEWVATLLNGEIAEAKSIADRIHGQHFPMYITRHLEAAKRHVRERYSGALDKRYGLIASSKAKNLDECDVPNSYTSTRNVRTGPWFVDDPTSLNSCCALTSVVTEFGCQGLELDFPIVAWGDDLIWMGDRWRSESGRSKAKDPHQLRLNSYRVLLTRGRDGLIVFVPNTSDMEATAEALKAAGLCEFGRSPAVAPTAG